MIFLFAVTLLFSSCQVFQPANSSSDKTYNGSMGDIDGKKKEEKK